MGFTVENHPVNKGDPWILPGNDWQASWLEQGALPQGLYGKECFAPPTSLGNTLTCFSLNLWDTAIRPVVILGGWILPTSLDKPPMTRFASLCLDPISVPRDTVLPHGLFQTSCHAGDV